MSVFIANTFNTTAKHHRSQYLGTPVVVADRSPAAEGRRGAVAGDNLAVDNLAVDILAVVDTLAAVEGRPRQVVAPASLGRAVPGRVGTPDLPWEQRNVT